MSNDQRAVHGHNYLQSRYQDHGERLGSGATLPGTLGRLGQPGSEERLVSLEFILPERPGFSVHCSGAWVPGSVLGLSSGAHNGKSVFSGDGSHDRTTVGGLEQNIRVIVSNDLRAVHAHETLESSVQDGAELDGRLLAYQGSTSGTVQAYGT